MTEPVAQVSLHAGKAALTEDNELLLKQSGVWVKVAGVAGVGAPTGTGVSVAEISDGITTKTVFTFSNFAIVGVDDTGVGGVAAVKIYDMPAGVIQFVGSTADLALTKSSAGINDTWDGDFGVGTATGTAATLATTEQNIIPTTATPQAVAGATTATGFSTATENANIDGTSTAVDVYLNILIDDADHDIDSTPANVIVNGTLTLVWRNLGDY